MTLFDHIFAGGDAVLAMTKEAVHGAVAQYGAAQAVSLPGTAYSLPCYYAVTGAKIGTLGEMEEALGTLESLMTRNPRLHDAFYTGIATALCAEFLEALQYLNGAKPYQAPCVGHLPDAAIRELGVPLVTGDIPGVAVILGTAPSTEAAAKLVKSYQAQGILVTLVGGVIDQVEEAGIQTGANLRILPLGKGVTAVIHVVSVALRAALIFGNVTPRRCRGAPGVLQDQSARLCQRICAHRRCGARLRRRRHRPGLPGHHQRAAHLLARAHEPHPSARCGAVQRHQPGGAEHPHQGLQRGSARGLCLGL